MALVGRLATRDLLGPVNQAFYVNNTLDGIIVTVSFCNRNAYSVNISLAVSTSATNPGDAEWIEYGTEILAKGVLERTYITVGAGQYLVARSSSANVNVVCWGIGAGELSSSPVSITANVADGSTAARAARSAADIKALTGTNTDGVYWIRAAVDAPAQQVYCIMDPTWDGGGWMVLANNSASTFVASSGHIPRLTSNPAYVGTNGSNSYSPSFNFSVNAQGMAITKVAWCAYSGGNWKNIYTYVYGTFNAAKYIPDSSVYVRRFDTYHQTLPWLTASDIRTRPSWTTDPTDQDTQAFSAIAIYDGQTGSATFGQPVGYERPTVLCRNNGNTQYPISDNNTNCWGVNGIFSFSANGVGPDAPTASFTGWDDWQDGNSLGDGWGTVSQVNYGRGYPSFIMVK